MKSEDGSVRICATILPTSGSVFTYRSLFIGPIVGRIWIRYGELYNLVLRKFAVNKFAVGKVASEIFASGNFAAVKFCTPSIYPPPCTFPSTVHCPVHLHTEPAPSVYTAFRLLGEIS